MKKPIFFISSTIFDLKDLRSSIKWWLEENGYVVNASEFNDFDKPLNTSSYEACLKAIDNSDYFILIIGERIGGMYDNEITITQKEYRHAYERMLTGKLKIISLIRQDTITFFSTFKTKINELKKDGIVEIDFLLTPQEKIKFKFIDEVRRVEEMKEGKKPKNNWLHTFNTFKDIIDVFRIELGKKSDIIFKQNRFIILRDICENLKNACSKNKDKIYPIGFMRSELWEEYKIDTDTNKLTLTNDQYLDYAPFYVSCLQMKSFRASRIESFYKAGFFLEYNKEQDDFISGDINQMVLQLLDTYDRLNSLHKSMYEGPNNKLISLGKKPDNSHLNVSSIEIFIALQFYDNLINCINLSKNLYNALMERQYIVPIVIRQPRMPERMKYKDENVISDTDIYQYLNL